METEKGLGRDVDWKMTDEKGGHKFGWYKDFKYQSCRICGLIRRADDNNNPCRGPVEVTLR